MRGVRGTDVTVGWLWPMAGDTARMAAFDRVELTAGATPRILTDTLVRVKVPVGVVHTGVAVLRG